MACNGCGETPAMTKEQVENLIQSKIDEGKIQGGLKSCGGEKLPAESQVILCSQLAEKVKELITNGTVDVVTDVAVEEGKLVVTDGTGKKVKTDLPGLKNVEVKNGKLVTTPINGTPVETKLNFAEDLAFDSTENKLTWKEGGESKNAKLPYLKGVATEKALVVTLPDGTTAELPKAGHALTEDSFDETIEKGANKANKFGVKLKNNGGVERTVDGIAVKIKEGSGLERDADGLGVKLKDKSGLERTPTGLGIKLGDGVTVDENGAIQLGQVFASNPIKGKGTKADPLTLALSQRDFVVNPVSGEISLKAVQNDAVTNLNNGTPVFGYSTFFGVVDKARGKYVIGVPADISSEVESQNATAQISELADGQEYEFNGWQIASSVQVDQYLVGTDKAVWHRINDEGMNPDGSLRNPNGWSVWRRETNNSVSVVQIQQMQNQINDHENRIRTLEAANVDLAGRVKALEDMLAGFVPLKDASGTVQLGLIKP